MNNLLNSDVGAPKILQKHQIFGVGSLLERKWSLLLCVQAPDGERRPLEGLIPTDDDFEY